METTTYVRKPFEIEAVQVTNENMEEVANWCKGLITSQSRGSRTVSFIEVKVHYRSSLNKPDAARVGDYVCYGPNGFRVYRQKPFSAGFEKKAADEQPATA